MADTADRILRLDAIEIFGKTYIHDGNWEHPIVELLGDNEIDPDPLSRSTTYPDEQSAVEAVRALALAAAEQTIIEIDAKLSEPLMRFQLWLGRNWSAMRDRQIGALATADLLDQERRKAEAIFDKGPSITVRKLPDVMRLPAILEVGTSVHVLDTRSFPDRPARLFADTIAHIDFIRLDAHPQFDAVARYRLAHTEGTFAYDYVETDRQMLDGLPGLAQVYLERDVAEAAAIAFRERIRMALDGLKVSSDPLLLPPPQEPSTSFALVPVEGPPTPSDGPMVDEAAIREFLESGLSLYGSGDRTPALDVLGRYM